MKGEKNYPRIQIMGYDEAERSENAELFSLAVKALKSGRNRV